MYKLQSHNYITYSFRIIVFRVRFNNTRSNNSSVHNNMDVNFEKRLLRPANANIISPNGLSRASRNLFGRSPVEAGSSQYSLRSPTRNVSPSISVSKTDFHDMLLE